MDAVFVRARNPAEAREVLDAAYTMASEITNDEREWVHVFDKAVELLAQGSLITMGQQQVPFDLSRIKRG